MTATTKSTHFEPTLKINSTNGTLFSKVVNINPWTAARLVWHSMKGYVCPIGLWKTGIIFQHMPTWSSSMKIVLLMVQEKSCQNTTCYISETWYPILNMGLFWNIFLTSIGCILTTRFLFTTINSFVPYSNLQGTVFILHPRSLTTKKTEKILLGPEKKAEERLPTIHFPVPLSRAIPGSPNNGTPLW